MEVHKFKIHLKLFVTRWYKRLIANTMFNFLEQGFVVTPGWPKTHAPLVLASELELEKVVGYFLQPVIL